MCAYSFQKVCARKYRSAILSKGTLYIEMLLSYTTELCDYQYVYIVDNVSCTWVPSNSLLSHFF